ncbi:hypothetical protein J7L70_04170 [Candidatus Bathyarchaeota archaeon]|nr:hypothetical protein [Candidatus Bathyarchaeota archaeon]
MNGYKVDAKALEKRSRESSKVLLSFLETKLGSKLVLKDGVIEIPDTKGLSKKTLKVWIKHLLRKEGLKEEFKVSVEGDVLIMRARS